VDVAQEAHFSNRDTWDSCQDGKQIKDVGKQSAMTPQRGVFFFVRPAGRTQQAVKVLYTPGKGKCWPDARVSRATANPRSAGRHVNRLCSTAHAATVWSRPWQLRHS